MRKGTATIYLEEHPFLVLRRTYAEESTWFGVVDRLVADEGVPLVHRAMTFRAFCLEWHRQLHQADPPDPDAFRGFADILGEVTWRVVWEDGSEMALDQGPIFFDEAEVTWGPRVET